ncbi:MAG TPA: hypothetical protein VGU02_04440 [Gaiellaceae bacterium]|nr:hypothetical protein [Gaiellaceae bacterium]
MVELRGKPLGGNNPQAVVRSPDAPAGERDLSHQDVLTLPSGWIVSVSNKFADQPQVAASIFVQLENELDDLIRRASSALATGDFDRFRAELFAVELRANGPDYWR